jgi:hypothetical protein
MIRPLLIAGLAILSFTPARAADSLRVGFAEEDITPKLDGKPVFMAGFGQNRRAAGVLDPLMARAVVLDDGTRRVALVSLDLVGFFHPQAENVRKRLPGFAHVLVCSTHNHEGPDTLGLWGPNPFTSGIDPEYVKRVEEKATAAVTAAAAGLKPVRALIGTATAPELLHDARPPIVKHDELVALEFREPQGEKPVGVIVQWNCHPETLDSKNTRLSADFVAATVKELKQRKGCPVLYLTGTVGGLMTSLHVEIAGPDGRPLRDGTVEKTEAYGRRVAELAVKALEKSQPVRLTPMAAHTRELFLPVENRLYLVAWQLGVLDRQPYTWSGDPRKAEPVTERDFKKPMSIRTEVGWLRLGELDVAAIPGEIYPELVLDKVADPADPAADFPDAPIEPAVYKQLPGKYRMLIGLANDEIGYIIPKRQWDEKPPYTYGQKKPPYGEINSLGPNTAPLLCEAFRDLVKRNR